MSTKPWTQLWLEYKKVNSKGNEAYVKSVILEGFDAAQPVIKNALQELKCGVQGMLGQEICVKTGAKTTDEPALHIVKQLTTSCDLEGAYRLVEKSGSLTLLAGEESAYYTEYFIYSV
jgi:alpha-glucuronidase